MEIDPWLARATARRPEAVALETPDERLTYRELLMVATRAASRLVLRGAGAGDRVALTLPPGRDFVVAFHACLLLRAPAMPILAMIARMMSFALTPGGMRTSTVRAWPS